MIRQVDVYRSTSNVVGGCNGCTDRPTSVLVVTLRAVEFRLCPECEKLLLKELREAKK